MRHDEMLRLGLDCSRLAIRGDDFGYPLAAGIERIMHVDAGVGVLSCHLNSDRAVDGMQQYASASGPLLGSDALQAAAAVAARHPSFAPQRFLAPHVERLSDLLPIGPFRETDVWAAIHAHSDGLVRARFPAAVNLGRHGDQVILAAFHRERTDVDDEDLEVLEVLVCGPLVHALAFRHSWDKAIRTMNDCLVATSGRRITPRETQVLAMVAAGDTNKRIAHVMGISERTVRKHLENVNDKLGTANRAAAVNRWRMQSLQG